MKLLRIISFKKDSKELINDDLHFGSPYNLAEILNFHLNNGKPLDEIWFKATVERFTLDERQFLNFRREVGGETIAFKCIFENIVVPNNNVYSIDLLEEVELL